MLGTRLACGAFGLVCWRYFRRFPTSPKRAYREETGLQGAPKYPRELKQNAIGGIVRLSISISPNGSVGKISPIGGNPILVDAATLAVKQWKYVPADHPTTTEVQLDFIPNRE